MGQIVYRQEINKDNWELLLRKTPNASLYVELYYLDALAENWCAYTNAEFSYAIPFSYKKMLGVKNIYPPFFQSFIHAIGAVDQIDWEDFQKTIKKEFKRGTLFIRDEISDFPVSEKRRFQIVSPAELTLKDQAKRKLKLAEKADYVLKRNCPTNELTKIITQELGKKLSLYHSRAMQRFKRLLQEAEKRNQLISFGLYKGDQLLGGVFALKNDTHFFFLKGACRPEVNKNGGMYQLMYKLIQEAHHYNMVFDFGGSNVDGVRFFNTRFGAKDRYYFKHDWNFSPVWYKIVLQLNKTYKSLFLKK